MPEDAKAIGLKLRAMALGLTPQAIGLPASATGLYGAIMDWGVQPDAIATIVAIVDGSTSVYAGGGGFLGGQGIPAVKQAGRKFIEAAARFANGFEVTTDFPTPAGGHTIFYLLTTSGVRRSPEIDVATLHPGQKGMSELFGAAQEIITQFRLHSPKQ